MIKRLPTPQPTPVWLPERVALLRARYSQEGAVALVAPLNELPGLPVNVESVREKVWSLRLRMDPAAKSRLQRAASKARAKQSNPAPPAPAEPVPFPASFRQKHFVDPIPPAPNLPPDQQAALADAAMERKREKARAMLAKKACPHAVAANARLPLREVFRLIGEARA